MTYREYVIGLLRMKLYYPDGELESMTDSELQAEFDRYVDWAEG